MTEKAKTDEKVLQEKTRLVIAVAVIAVIFGVLYVTCRIIGGAAEAFAVAAAPWVFWGTIVAGALVYLSIGKKK